MAEKSIEPPGLTCPKCGRVMQPLKTKNKYRCTACKIKAEQLTIDNMGKAP